MADIKFCPECGARRVESGSFCMGCGKPFQADGFQHVWWGLIGVFVLSFALYGFIKYPARDAIKEMSKHEVDHTAHTPQGHTHDEPEWLLEIKEKANSGRAADLMDLADGYIRMASDDKHYLEGAADALQRLLASYPNHAYSWRLLGNIYYDLARAESAIPAYESYLKIHPDDPNVRTDLGVLLLNSNRPEDAIAAWKKAIELFPNHYHASYNLSVAYKGLDQMDEANAWIAKATEIEQEHGKIMAPERELARLPEGVEANPPLGDPTKKSLVVGDVDYAPMDAFFKAHPVIGPKRTDFGINDQHAILKVRQFPMDKMPASMRETFELKIVNLLTALGENAGLEIRDADDNRLLAAYGSAKKE